MKYNIADADAYKAIIYSVGWYREQSDRSLIAVGLPMNPTTRNALNGNRDTKENETITMAANSGLDIRDAMRSLATQRGLPLTEELAETILGEVTAYAQKELGITLEVLRNAASDIAYVPDTTKLLERAERKYKEKPELLGEHTPEEKSSLIKRAAAQDVRDAIALQRPRYVFRVAPEHEKTSLAALAAHVPFGHDASLALLKLHRAEDRAEFLRGTLPAAGASSDAGETKELDSNLERTIQEPRLPANIHDSGTIRIDMMAGETVLPPSHPANIHTSETLVPRIPDEGKMRLDPSNDATMRLNTPPAPEPDARLRREPGVSFSGSERALERYLSELERNEGQGPGTPGKR